MVRDQTYEVCDCFGLFIHCNKIGSNGIEKVIYQGVNVVLGVDKEEAKQLFQLWQEISIQNKSAVERQHPVKKRRAKKAAGFFDLLQGGKSVVVGIMALPLAFLELLSGRWLLSLLWSLASVTAITLGVGAQNAKFSGKQGLFLRNALILLLGVWIVLLLIVSGRK